MITQIRLVDFQRHLKLQVDFDPITTIVGPTDSGKSSILRALRWLALNQPSGSSFINWEGAKSATVIGTIDDRRVARTHGTQNAYKLDEESYKAFGKGKVPDPIREVLNVTELNFQGQHDPAFWFSLTAGDVAKRLNAIVDLEAIDVALGEAATRVRKQTTAFDLAQERVAKYEERVENLVWVDDVEADFKSLGDVEAASRSKRAVFEALGTIVDAVTQNTSDRDRALEAKCDVDELLGLYEVADVLRNSVCALVELGKQIKTTREAIKATPTRDELTELADLLEDAKLKQRDVNRLGDRIEAIEGAEREHDEAYTTWKDKQNEVESVGVLTCTECGQAVNDG